MEKLSKSFLWWVQYENQIGQALESMGRLIYSDTFWNPLFVVETPCIIVNIISKFVHTLVKWHYIYFRLYSCLLHDFRRESLRDFRGECIISVIGSWVLWVFRWTDGNVFKLNELNLKYCTVSNSLKFIYAYDKTVVSFWVNHICSNLKCYKYLVQSSMWLSCREERDAKVEVWGFTIRKGECRNPQTPTLNLLLRTRIHIFIIP